MKYNSIELVTEISETGEPIKTETFLTRPTTDKLLLVYECVSFLSTIEDNPNNHQVQQMLDLVTRIYDYQFTKNQLMQGLTSYKAVPELYRQIVFIASGNQISDDIEETVKNNKDIDSQSVKTWKEYKGQLNSLIKEMTKEGKDINEVLNLPYTFMMSDLSEEFKKVEKTESMIAAFI